MKQQSTLHNRLVILLSSIGLAILLAVVFGCGNSATLYNEWRDESFQGKQLHNILVIALKNDPVRRRVWEDGFEAELKKYNITADPSYRYFPDAFPDTQQVIDLIQQHQFDGVITINRLANGSDERYVPGYTTQEPVTRYNRWTNNYYTYWRDVQHPGYTETETTIRHRIDVWSTSDGGKMVWSGMGDVVDPTSVNEVSREISRLIVPELSKHGIIPKKE